MVELPGSGAPYGERNGIRKSGRYSRAATPEQRRQAWKDDWADKREKNTALADSPDLGEELRTLWPQEGKCKRALHGAPLRRDQRMK